MSAYVVNHRHITALVHYAAQHGILRRMSLTPQTAGQILLAENVRSCNFRYDQKGDPLESPEVTSYEYKVYHKDIVRSPLEVIKATICYDYQSYETEDYRSTLAAKLVDSIRYEAITN